MVAPPRRPAAGDGTDASSNGLVAASAGAAIRLTASAERYAKGGGLETAFATARLGEGAAVGDVVTLEAGGRRHDLVVAQRRWLLRNDRAAVLELTLDHPARRGA